MRSPTSTARFVLFFVLACVITSTAMAQRGAGPEMIEERVERLLRYRDIGELANELARQTAQQTTESLLTKLSVFGRAGHRARVLDTIKQIVRAGDYKNSPYRSQVFHVAQKATANDLPAKRAFYELIAFGGDEHVSDFVWRWEKEGDVNELEKWLEPRASTNETWWNLWLQLKKRRGNAQEVYDKLAEAIRQDPSDFDSVQKYLRAVANNMPTNVPTDRRSYVQDVAWLADTVKTDLAYEAYDLGALIKNHAPVSAAKLFEKSLSLPFTQKDTELFGQRAFRGASVRPVGINPEKQLRYWTKTSLADVYLTTGQPQLAQPLAEDLTRMDTSDIQTGNSYDLAGRAQASSGHRVIESKILQDETANRDSPQYWIDRAVYYRGRREDEQTWQTLMSALEKFPYRPNDHQNKTIGYQPSSARLRVLVYLRVFGYSYEKREKETEEILRRELIKAISEKDGRFVFELTKSMENDFEDLFEELFVNTNLLTTVLSTFEAWRHDQEYLITEVMEDEKWDSKKKDVVWDQLILLARKDIRNRAFSLAKAMDDSDRSIPLLMDLKRIAPLGYEGNLNFNRQDVDEELFHSYNNTGDWRNAEKMYLAGFRYSGLDLSGIALTAAKANSPKDAVRIWKVNANLDRRNFNYLAELSKTEANLVLREFYLEMKRRDPLTDIPDKALALLN